jgi:hypothetical protein
VRGARDATRQRRRRGARSSARTSARSANRVLHRWVDYVRTAAASSCRGRGGSETNAQLSLYPTIMSQRKWMSCAAAVAVMAIASCGGDTITQPGSENLSTEQVQSMATALSSILIVAHEPSGASFTSPGHVLANRAMATSLPITGSLLCSGGHVGTNGTFSIDTSGNTIFALTDTLVACGVYDNHGNFWTFTTKPTLAVTMEVPTNIHGDSIDLAHSTLIQSVVGTVGYTTADLSGTCSVNVIVRLDVTRDTPAADSATVSLSTAGTVCGRLMTRYTTTTTYPTPP